MSEIFRKSLFGGFNRRDVTGYIVKLAEERNEYKERAEKAEEKLEALLGDQTEPAAEEPEIPEEPEDDIARLERMIGEIRESVAAVNEGIRESVASIKTEMENQEEDAVVPPAVPAVPTAPAKPDNSEVSDNISRVLGMLECTEAHFSLLEKTLQTIKTEAKNG